MWNVNGGRSQQGVCVSESLHGQHESMQAAAKRERWHQHHV